MRARRPGQERDRDRASVLMLMPAGILVVLLLGAIAFDLSLVFLRQRQASSMANDVANDVATAALDESIFRATGEYELDPVRAEDLGRALVLAGDVGPHVVDLGVDLLDADTVRVTVVVSVDYVFARAIPGAADGTTVTATAVADAVAG